MSWQRLRACKIPFAKSGEITVGSWLTLHIPAAAQLGSRALPLLVPTGESQLVGDRRKESRRDRRGREMPSALLEPQTHLYMWTAPVGQPQAPCSPGFRFQQWPEVDAVRMTLITLHLLAQSFPAARCGPLRQGPAQMLVVTEGCSPGGRNLLLLRLWIDGERV